MRIYRKDLTVPFYADFTVIAGIYRNAFSVLKSFCYAGKPTGKPKGVSP